MRWSVEPLNCGVTRHLALVPLDDEAAAVESWLVAPKPLCGNGHSMGRRCLDCVVRWSGVQAYVTVVKRRRAREEVADDVRI